MPAEMSSGEWEFKKIVHFIPNQNCFIVTGNNPSTERIVSNVISQTRQWFVTNALMASAVLARA